MKTPTLQQNLRNVSNMINMCEKIRWGQETTLMEKAADKLDSIYEDIFNSLEAELKARAKDGVHIEFANGITTAQSIILQLKNHPNT